jgi:hypothetical protein
MNRNRNIFPSSLSSNDKYDDRNINNKNISNFSYKDRILSLLYSNHEADHHRNTSNTTNTFKLSINEIFLRTQMMEHKTDDYLQYYIVNKNFKGLQERLKFAKYEQNDRELVLKMNSGGGNVIHLAYLFQQYDVGRWLVMNYPVEAAVSHSNHVSSNVYNEGKKYGYTITKEDMVYTGENILHIAVVHKNIEEVRWLLEFYSNHLHSFQYCLQNLLLSNCTGSFFTNKLGPFYCGCYPLHFAVCSNDIEMFNIILSYTSLLDKDAFKGLVYNGSQDNGKNDDMNDGVIDLNNNKNNDNKTLTSSNIDILDDESDYASLKIFQYNTINSRKYIKSNIPFQNISTNENENENNFPDLSINNTTLLKDTNKSPLELKVTSVELDTHKTTDSTSKATSKMNDKTRISDTFMSVVNKAKDAYSNGTFHLILALI